MYVCVYMYVYVCVCMCVYMCMYMDIYDAQDNTDHALACVWDANMWPGKHTHACRSALTHINSFGANAISDSYNTIT